jgi:nucleotide-binding universal stress UspA family protein
MFEEHAPLEKILLPLDSLETFGRVVPLAALLIRNMQVDPSRVDLLHVVAGSFLSDLMNRIDLAAGETPAAEDMKLHHQRYIEDTALPLLAHGADLLTNEIGRGAVGTMVRDGDPVKVINEVCRGQGYSTLIMSRRNLDEYSEKLTGSVVAGILHRYTEATIYLIGDEPLPTGASPFARCLIAVDGSVASKNSVAEAGMILARVNDQIEQVYLVHVLDQSCYYDEDGVTCLQASLTGQQALEESGNELVAWGVDREKIKTVIHFGKPGLVLAEEVNDCDATLIFIGRRDRSRMAQVFLGSVCTDIIGNCRERTIVLSC